LTTERGIHGGINNTRLRSGGNYPVAEGRKSGRELRVLVGWFLDKGQGRSRQNWKLMMLLSIKKFRGEGLTFLGGGIHSKRKTSKPESHL